MKKVKNLYDELSSEGLRILAIAEKVMSEKKEHYEKSFCIWGKRGSSQNVSLLNLCKRILIILIKSGMQKQPAFFFARFI